MVLIILIGAVLRVYDLGAESFWFDEIFTIHFVSLDLPTLIQQLTTEVEMTRHAVYYLSAHFWVLPSGISEVSIRSLSVIFGVLSIGMMYLVGRQLFGENVGLISSFLMAVSEFQIYHSQEARFYSLLVLLTLCSLYPHVKNKETMVMDLQLDIQYTTFLHPYFRDICYRRRIYSLLCILETP